MLCGYLKQTCRSITVKELIDILNTCKDKNAVIKLSGMTNFFIHFDKDGKYIDISKSPCANEYGMNKDKKCDKCSRYNVEEKCCGCDGSDCINASLMVDTEKFNEACSRVGTTPTDTESREVIEHTEVIEDKKADEVITNASVVEDVEEHQIPEKYNLDRIGINGVTSPVNIETLKDLPANTRVLIIPPEEKNMNQDEIQDAVDAALLNTLKKMINGIKGENK